MATIRGALGDDERGGAGQRDGRSVLWAGERVRRRRWLRRRTRRALAVALLVVAVSAVAFLVLVRVMFPLLG